MKKLLNLVAAPVLAIALTGGVAAAATNTTIGTTGQGSDQIVDVTNDKDVELENNNNTNASVDNNQDATSGDATVDGNTNGEDATTGNADTEFAVDAVVTHHNASASSYALNSADCDCNDVDTHIENTGQNSNAEVTVENTSKVKVTNNNNFALNVTNNQTSTTGDATVDGNTNGQDATTGDASAKASVTIDHETSN